MRGAGGGYVLAKPADSISVGDVLRVLEGGLEAVTCSVNEGLGGCDAADFCVTRFVWQRINEELRTLWIPSASESWFSRAGN